MGMHNVVIEAHGVTAEDVLAVARDGARVELSAEALAGIAAAREVVDALAAKREPVYGISTGFGALANRHIPRAAHPAAAQPDPLARRRHGPGWSARWSAR